MVHGVNQPSVGRESSTTWIQFKLGFDVELWIFLQSSTSTGSFVTNCSISLYKRRPCCCFVVVTASLYLRFVILWRLNDLTQPLHSHVMWSWVVTPSLHLHDLDKKKNMPLQNAYATNNVQCIFLVHITTCNHQGLVCLLSAATKSWGQQRVGRSTWGRCQVKHGYERNGATNHISHYIMTHSNHPKNITLILDVAKLFTNQNNHATGKYIYLFIHIYIHTHTHHNVCSWKYFIELSVKLPCTI